VKLHPRQSPNAQQREPVLVLQATELALNTGTAAFRQTLLVRSLMAEGLVVEAADGFRLTESAEQRFGQTLRAFSPTEGGGGASQQH
jgi:hypothetical protein